MSIVNFRRPAVRSLIAIAILAFTVALLDRAQPHLSQTTVALVLVTLVMLVAAWLGRGPGLLLALLAGLAFNYFFIPPFGSFRIFSGQDVIGFVALLLTAVIVGQLARRLETRTAEARAQRHQLVDVQEKFSATAAEAEALRRSELLKTALLDAVTHDLRTPLTSIKAAATTLRAPDLSPEARTELEEVIEQETDRLDHFIQGMVDLAQLEAGHLSLQGRRVACEAIIEDALERAAPVLRDLRVDVQSASPPPELVADPRLISQVVFNLIENAARYSPPQGTITVSVTALDGHVSFAVADQGPGVDPALRDRVFEKFFRAPGGKGMGLGLAIARGIVLAHGGSIQVEANPAGAGARFVVLIPQVPA